MTYLNLNSRIGLRQSGLSLVELMVSLAIGLFLIAGVISVFGKTSDLYRTNESAARIQETARYALSTIETDLRMANNWGLTSSADLIENAPTLDPANLPAANPSYSLPAGLAAYATTISSCGSMWAIKLPAYIEASNNAYSLTCAAYNNNASAGADQLTVRHVTAIPMDDAQRLGSAGQIKIQTSRVQGTLFADTAIPVGYLSPTSETHALVTHGYYIDDDSDDAAGTPSLRRKSLAVSAGGAPEIQDEEVVPNVEDLQVELGVDLNGDQNADYFVSPDTAIPAGDEIVAMRVWLMVRAERPEVGFQDDRSYQYADRNVTPNDGYRRLLVSKTIALRNTRR